MNAARVAALLRELANELDGEEPSEARPAPKSKLKVTELDKARARKALTRIGV